MCFISFLYESSTLSLYIWYAGIATAFAARDVIGNILSGLSLQISRPFTVGDTIKVCYKFAA